MTVWTAIRRRSGCRTAGNLLPACGDGRLLGRLGSCGSGSPPAGSAARAGLGVTSAGTLAVSHQWCCFSRSVCARAYATNSPLTSNDKPNCQWEPLRTTISIPVLYGPVWGTGPDLPVPTAITRVIAISKAKSYLTCDIITCQVCLKRYMACDLC
jgi:hypothetical protein